MSKLVDSLGVAKRNPTSLTKDTNVVTVSELESALEKLPVVYGGPSYGWDQEGESSDTHTARLLCVEEIKRSPLKHEFETEAVSNNEFGKLYTNMIPSSFVGKKVRVTVEEMR